MKVLAINLRADRTQVLAGTIKKNTLNVEHIEAVKPVFALLESRKTEELEDFFSDIQGRNKHKNALTYIALPDNLVQKIDCASREYVLAEQWDSVVSPWIMQHLQVNPEEFYITTPIHLKKKNRSIITGIAVRTTWIDRLFKGAMAAKLNLQTIEPACFALLRYLNQWGREHCIMEVGERTTSIVSYNPIRGMFKIAASYGWTHFLAEGAEEFEQCVATYDYTAFNTHGLTNVNVPIYLVSSKARELFSTLQTSKIQDRLSMIPAGNLKEQLQTELNGQMLMDYSAAIGLALTPLHERMMANGNTAS